MATSISVAQLGARINAILTERLDHVRLAVLFQYQQKAVREVYASAHDRPDRHIPLGSAAYAIAALGASLLAGKGNGVDELVLVGSQERVFIFPYGTSLLVVVTREAIGDVCYHCRWDQTRVFGILPNIYAAGVDTPRALLSRRLRSSAPPGKNTSVGSAVSSAAAPDSAPEVAPDTSPSQDLLDLIRTPSATLSRDLDYESLVMATDDGRWAEAREGRAVADAPGAANVLRPMRELLASAVTLAAILRKAGIDLGELRELVVSRTASHWEQESREAPTSLVLTHHDVQRAWTLAITRERLGRALFSTRRAFHPYLISDDSGRPSVEAILHRWYATSCRLGLRFSSGIFYRAEKLWLGSDAEPADILEVEIPDVAGSLLDSVARSPLHQGPGAVLEVALELHGASEDLADRRFTMLVPLKAGLCIFISCGGIIENVRRGVLSSADDLRAQWYEKKGDAERPLQIPDWIKDALVVTSAAPGLQRPARFQSEWLPSLPPASRAAIHAAGFPDYLVEVGHRLAVLAYVLTHKHYGWNALIRLDGCVLQFTTEVAETGDLRSIRASASVRGDVAGHRTGESEGEPLWLAAEPRKTPVPVPAAPETAIGSKTPDYQELVQTIRATIADLGLSDQARGQLKTVLLSLESELASPEPKSAVVNQSLRTARSILEGIAGSLLASGIGWEIVKLMAH